MSAALGAVAALGAGAALGASGALSSSTVPAVGPPAGPSWRALGADEDECRRLIREIWQTHNSLVAPILLRRELARRLGVHAGTLNTFRIAEIASEERAARRQLRRKRQRDTSAVSGEPQRAEVLRRRRAETPDSGWKEIWEARQFTDASILCQGHRLEAHRAVLAVRSPVLKAMFEQEGMREGSEREVTIQNSTPDIVEAMVKYMYVRDIDEGVDCARLLLLADQYQVQSLAEACVDVMLEELSQETVAMSLATLRKCRQSPNSRVAEAYEQVLDRIHQRGDKGLLRAIAEHVSI